MVVITISLFLLIMECSAKQNHKGEIIFYGAATEINDGVSQVTTTNNQTVLNRMSSGSDMPIDDVGSVYLDYEHFGDNHTKVNFFRNFDTNSGNKLKEAPIMEGDIDEYDENFESPKTVQKEGVKIFDKDSQKAKESAMVDTIHRNLGMSDVEEPKEQDGALNAQAGKYRGEKISPGQFPFLVFVMIMGVNDIDNWCMGVILSNQYVITSANCIHNPKTNRTYPPKLYWIIAGISNLQNVYKLEGRRQVHECYKVIIYSDYKYGELGRHDIALLEVVRSFMLNKYVKAAKISAEVWPEMESRDCIAIGCRINNCTKEAPRFQTVNAKRGTSACTCTEKNKVDTLICTKGHGICYGDPGAPLICNGIVMGIGHVNLQKDCQFNLSDTSSNCNNHQQYGTFMYINCYRAFFKQYIPNIVIENDNDRIHDHHQFDNQYDNQLDKDGTTSEDIDDDDDKYDNRTTSVSDTIKNKHETGHRKSAAPYTKQFSQTNAFKIITLLCFVQSLDDLW